MELRNDVANIVYRAIRVNAWSDENCKKWADEILALPEIKEGEQLRRLCYLHDGPGGVSVQMRAVDSAPPRPQS